MATLRPTLAGALRPPLSLPVQGLAASQSARRLLRVQLQAALGASATSQLGIRLPGEADLRMRNLIHRGAPRPTSRLRSLTMDRSIQCESILEVETAKLLDACPRVTAFAEQPLELRLPGRDGECRHIPDFVVLVDGRLELVEVKHKRDVSREVLERTVTLQRMAPTLGFEYRLVTESLTRAGHRLENANRLLRRAVVEPTDQWRLRVVEQIRRAGGLLPLGYFGWENSGTQEAGWIARMLIQGQLYVDLTSPLTTDSAVSINQPNIEENRLWPVASK